MDVPAVSRLWLAPCTDVARVWFTWNHRIPLAPLLGRIAIPEPSPAVAVGVTVSVSGGVIIADAEIGFCGLLRIHRQPR